MHDRGGPDRFYCGVGLLPGGHRGFLSVVFRRNEQKAVAVVYYFIQKADV